MVDPSQSHSEATTKQHYVPRFYLRRFANDGGVVERLDLTIPRILSPTGPGGLAYERYFYGLWTGEPDETSQEIETFLGGLEDRLAKDMPSAIECLSGRDRIDDEHKRAISWLMSMLWVRGPVVREMAQGLEQHLLKESMSRLAWSPEFEKRLDDYEKKHGEKLTPELRTAVTEDFRSKSYDLRSANHQHLALIGDIPGFAGLFFAQDWRVFITHGDRFVTSDNPVGTTIPKTTGLYGPTFLERTHTFALTPEILIVAGPPRSGSVKTIRRRTIDAVDRSAILRHNVAIANCAYERVFARDRTSLDGILTIVERARASSSGTPPQLQQRRAR